MSEKAPARSVRSHHLQVGTVFALISGLVLVLAPYACYRALAAVDIDRASAILYGATAMAAVVVALLIGTSDMSAMLIGAGVGGGIAWWLGRRRSSEVDFVVEEPLLAGAVSPEVAVGLHKLEEQALEQGIEAEEEPDRRSFSAWGEEEGVPGSSKSHH